MFGEMEEEAEEEAAVAEAEEAAAAAAEEEENFDYEGFEVEAYEGLGIPEEYFYGEWEYHEGMDYWGGELEQPVEEIPEEQVAEEDSPPDLENEIKRVEELRARLQNTKRRKTVVRGTVIELLEMGLLQLDTSDNTGTEEQLVEIYENSLREFKATKEFGVERQKELTKELFKWKALLSTEVDKYNEISDQHYDVEFKNGLGMIYEGTRQKMTEEKLNKIITSSKTQNPQFAECGAKLISMWNECKRLKEETEYLSTSTIDIKEYNGFIGSTHSCENRIAISSRKIFDDRKTTLFMLEGTANCSNKIANFHREKKQLESKMTIAKKIWSENVKALEGRRKLAAKKKEQKAKGWFADDPLMLRDYRESVEIARQKKALVAELEETLRPEDTMKSQRDSNKSDETDVFLSSVCNRKIYE